MRSVFMIMMFVCIGLFGGYTSDSRQYIVVHSRSWSSSDAILERYERSGDTWKRVGKPFAVKIGRNGMGWGLGLHAQRAVKPIKREGDGKSPAGIFSIPFAFGETGMDTRMRFRIMKSYHICVDDSRSVSYNRIVDSRKAKRDYRSFEKMKLKSGLYRYGIFVSHNPSQKAMAGSCIFMHIKRRDGKGTSGCTAMTKTQIKELIKWLDPSKKPLLVQAADAEVGVLLPFRLQPLTR